MFTVPICSIDRVYDIFAEASRILHRTFNVLRLRRVKNESNSLAAKFLIRTYTHHTLVTAMH